MTFSRIKKGFTLAELLIVVAIIAVLVAISIPIFSSQLKKARLATDQANVRSAKAAAAAEYMTDGETGSVSYLYDGSKAVKLTGSFTSMSGKGYGKSDSYENTGAISGTPKDNFVEVTVNDSASSSTDQLQARWVSSAGAGIIATGEYVFSGDITKNNITSQLYSAGVNPEAVTSFKAAGGSQINETVKSDGNGARDNSGVLVDTFKDFPNLKTIDLSQANLSTGNINLFRDLPASVQEIKLPESSTDYDIRGIWYYAGGEKVQSPTKSSSGANISQDSRITTGHNGVTIYRSQEAAKAASNTVS